VVSLAGIFHKPLSAGSSVLTRLNPLGSCSQNWPTFSVFVDLVHEDEHIQGLEFLQYFEHGLEEYSKFFGELF